jgi:hypothetical protein
MIFQPLLLQRRSALAGTFARAGIGTRTLTSHRQAAAMTESPVATDIHQTLDVHGRFAAKVALDRELGDLIADLFEIAVSQVLDFLGICNVAGFANFASARATNAKNSRQADFSVLMRRNIDASDTCHMLPLNLYQSALTLLVARIRADDTNHALAPDDLAVAANFLDRSRNSHFILLKPA